MDEGPRFELDGLSGTAQPAHERWPADSPLVLVDEKGPRGAFIEPGMFFAVDLTSLAPPAR